MVPSHGSIPRFHPTVPSHVGHAAVIRHWAQHTNQRAAVLQRKAQEAEVEAAVDAADRFMADATARFPNGTATARASARATARPNARACCHGR